MDATLIAYLAGIFDGEGSVGMWSQGARQNRRFEMHVKMAHEPTIDLLVATFGGGKQIRPPEKKGWQPQWSWRISRQPARKAYEQMKPYLRIKTGETKWQSS